MAGFAPLEEAGNGTWLGGSWDPGLNTQLPRARFRARAVGLWGRLTATRGLGRGALSVEAAQVCLGGGGVSVFLLVLGQPFVD